MVSIDTVIIGAGAAGLATAACLEDLNVSYAVLEQAPTVASSWRKHYDRLHLHTDKGHSGLPFLPMPGSYPRYPSRDQVIRYLEDYTRYNGIEPRFNHAVSSVMRADGRWLTKTRQAVFESRNLVVATGYAREPVIPRWPAMDSYGGTILHSSQYINGKSFRDRRVLVVGFGNSAGEIAVDLHENGAGTALAVRSPVNVLPRDILGIPVHTLAIPLTKTPPSLADALAKPLVNLIFGKRERYGLKPLPYGPITQIKRHSRVPLIDIGIMKLLRKGAVRILPGIGNFTENGVAFTDGTQENFDAVICATGYAPRVDRFLTAPGALSEEGTPLSSGVPAGSDGLYFCGFYITPTGMLREIAMESKLIAGSICGTG